MAYNPVAFDPIGYDVTASALHIYTSNNRYWIPLKCVIEVYDNTGNTLLLSYDMFNPEINPIKLLECTVSLGLTNTQFTLKFEDGQGTINQNSIGLGNKVLVYAGRSSDNLTLLFTGYSENRTPTIISDHVMNYEMSGYGENASLNDLIINFKRASTQLTEIEDPNFPKRPDSKMVVHELVRDIFEDSDVRVTKDIILKDYLGLDISGISPLVTERLLSIVQGMTEVSQVLNFLTEVTGAYWKIENGKLFFEYPETQHSGIVIKNKVSNIDLANSTSYFIGPWQYTDSISKDNGFANRIYTTTSTDTKSVANSMTNKGATALFDRAIAVQVTLLETRVNTIALIMSKIGDPFTPLSDEEEIDRGGPPTNPPPDPPVTCPAGYHLENGQCVPDTEPVVCPTGYHFDTTLQQCVQDTIPPPPVVCPVGYHYDETLDECVSNTTPNVCPIGYHFDNTLQQCVQDTTPPVCPVGYHFDTSLQQCVSDTVIPPPPTMDVQIMGFVGDTDGSTPQTIYQSMKSKGATRFGHMGDVSYSSSASTQLGYITSQLGFSKDNMVCSIGNHDHPNEDGSQGVLDDITSYFELPSTTYAQSRQWQNVYVIAMNTQDNSFSSTSSAQYLYVKSELEHATALKAQGLVHWVIVLIHKPFYIGSGNDHPADEEGGRSIYQTLFDTHKVDIVFHGHNHNIDIFKPLASGGTLLATATNNVYDFTKPHGQFYATVGSGGRARDAVSNATNSQFTTGGSFGYVLLTFNNTGLVCQFQVFSSSGAILHEFSINKQGSTTPPPPVEPICPNGYHWDTIIKRCLLDTTPPPPPPTTATLYRFVSWGDNDTTQDAINVLDRIFTEPNVSQYLFVGDGPYSTSGTAWTNMMSNYFPVVPCVTKKTDLILSQGNHDHAESESQQAENDIEAWFPGLNNANEGLEWLSSKIVGNVFIISMNSQDPNLDQIGGTQYNWVQARLNEAKTMRASGQIDWIITMVHKSWFNRLSTNQAYVTARHAYAAMFRDAQVDFMLHGHNHNTVVWKPIVAIAGNNDNQGGAQVFTLATNGAYDFSKDHGVMYITNGHGGHEHNVFGQAAGPNILFSNDTDYGYTVIDIQGKQATIKCKNVSGTVMYTTNVTRGSSTTPPPPPTCTSGYHWDTTLQQCVQDNPPTGGEGEIDSYGIKWLVARGQQFVVTQSRDEAADDRWSGNNTGLRNGIEQTMIGRSHGTNSSSHFASKLFGGNHSGSGASSQRWYDLGIRVDGEVQLQWEGPHPNNHDFTLPSSKQFITNIGKGLENNWIGLKWVIQTIVTNGSPANGGVRCRMWVDTDPINPTTNRPNNNWRLCFDFIDGIDVQVISPQSYQAPDEQDCEIRRSDTNSHDIYGLGTIVTNSGEGDPGLHLRRMGSAVQNFADLPANLQADFMQLTAKKKATPLLVTDKNKTVGKPCVAYDCPNTTRLAMMKYTKQSEVNNKDVVQLSEEAGLSFDNKIVQSVSQLAEQVVKGEIRIDNENKPTGPVISQFKVDVGGLSSTADTIFVNDVKVDASVLSPNGKYWIVLLPCGTSHRNTVLWHHDGDMITLDKYSAFAKGATRNDLSDWQVSRYGPTYCHAVFARLRRIQEYSDPQSIRIFRLKEDMADADFLDDSLSVAKMMQNILAIRGKPVRKYSINEVTLPTEKWLTPGQNVTIVDDTGHHEEDKNISAEIQEVSYSWSTSASDSTIGTFKVNVLPVGHLNWHKELFPSGD